MCKFNFSNLFKFLAWGHILLLTHFNLYGQQKSTGEGRLRVQLRNGVFRTAYELILKKGGSDEVDDADAASIGEGFLTLVGLSPSGTRLAIEERRADTLVKEINLLISGWSAGGYSLHFSPGPLLRDYHLSLKDHHLQSSVDIVNEDTVYEFSMEDNKSVASIKSRFTLILEPKRFMYKKVQENAIRIYPNPFHDLYIDMHLYDQPTVVTIRDLAGRLLFRTTIAAFCTECKIAIHELPAAPYLVELFDQQSGRRLKSLKMIKQPKYD